MKNNSILLTKKILCGLSAVAILGAVGCTYTDRQNDGYAVSTPNTHTVAQQDYVYYPTHNVYYSRGADNFRVYEGNRWVTVNTPRNVNRQRVLATESVSIAQYGTPERHYTEYVQPNLLSGSQSVGRVVSTPTTTRTSTRTVRY